MTGWKQFLEEKYYFSQIFKEFRNAKGGMWMGPGKKTKNYSEGHLGVFLILESVREKIC